jgi:acetoacetyl-CoA synthetase
LPPTLRRVRETMGRAMTAYRPRPYHAGPVVYLRAAIRQQHRGDPVLLWRHVARAGLKIADVPCSHFDMVLEPNLQIVAQILDDGLASA